MKWTADDEKRLRDMYPDTLTAEVAKRLGRTVRQVYNKATVLRLFKSEAYLAGPHACRLRRGGNIGEAYRFQPGQMPHNKGRAGWDAGGRSAETRFKKGELNGKAARLYKPIGSERINDEGYLERKVSDEGRSCDRWKGVHTLLWEERYGPVPAGYMVCFIDGNKQNLSLDNFALLSRGDRMRLNSYHNRYPKEIARLIQLRGALMRQINKRAGHEKQD